LEWHFAEGEVVWECRSSQKCVIEVVGDTFAEVNFQMKEGTKQVSLSDLLKKFHPGDFIEVMGGRFWGQSRRVQGGTVCRYTNPKIGDCPQSVQSRFDKEIRSSTS
jgi:hypothetical protein